MRGKRRRWQEMGRWREGKEEDVGRRGGRGEGKEDVGKGGKMRGKSGGNGKRGELGEGKEEEVSRRGGWGELRE